MEEIGIPRLVDGSMRVCVCQNLQYPHIQLAFVDFRLIVGHTFSGAIIPKFAPAHGNGTISQRWASVHWSQPMPILPWYLQPQPLRPWYRRPRPTCPW